MFNHVCVRYEEIIKSNDLVYEFARLFFLIFSFSVDMKQCHDLTGKESSAVLTITSPRWSSYTYMNKAAVVVRLWSGHI